MDSKRQQKIARLLQKEISTIFTTDTKSLFEGAFISVTQAKVSSDLSIAKIYLSFILAKDKEALLTSIRQQTKAIRQLLASKVKNQLRVVPELQFYIDDSAEYADKMNNIISNLNIPPEDQDSSKTE